MSNYRRWLILLIVSSALFLVVIDMTVLYTALPGLTSSLRATASEKLWIVTAYGLVVAGLLPGAGTLGDRLGHKAMFTSGLAVFGAASLIAAFAPSPAILIAGRVVLAVGAAMMMPATLSIIRVTFTDERERALAIGVWGAVASSGAAVGPLVGGALLEYFWWGSVFLINVPLVVLSLAAALLLIPESRRFADRDWDLAGSLQIMAGLIGLAYVIEELGKHQPSYAAVTIAAGVTIAATMIFIRRQLRSTSPLIDFSLFRDRDLTLGVAVAAIAALGITGFELALSQRLQLILGYSPLQAALFILPAPVAAFIGGPLAGWALPRMGAPGIMWRSLLTGGIGTAGFLACQDGNWLLQIACIAAYGLGLGAAMAAASNAIMSQAPTGREGMAASVEEVSFEFGGTIGASIFGSILSGVYTASVVLPEELPIPATVRESIDEALTVAERLPAEAATILTAIAHRAFDQAFTAVLAAATVMLLGAAFAVGAARGGFLRR